MKTLPSRSCALAALLLCPLASPALAAAPARSAPAAQTAPSGPHAFSFDDLAHLAKVSDPQVSPDGKSLYFAISWPRLELNRWQSAIYVQPLTAPGQPSAPPQRLTFPERGPKQEGGDSSPRLSPDGRSLAFLSTRDGSSPQVYLLRIGAGEARKLTNLPSGASDILWSPDSRALVVETRVFFDCPAYPAGEECNKTRTEAHEHQTVKARLTDRLFYRWWDSWYDGQRGHLLRVLVPGGDEPVATPVDLTPQDLDTPSLARHGAEPVAFSPDGRELAFVQNRDKDPSLSTNQDVVTLSLTADLTPGTGQARNLTEGNLATDIAPHYSPDGRYLAYLAQRRPGFEADRFEVWLRDRQSGQQRSLTESFDANVNSLAWSPDSRRIYIVAGAKGRDVLYSIDLSGKGAPTEISVGDCSDLQVRRSSSGDGATLIFGRSSLYRPSELFRIEVGADGKPVAKAEQLTHVNDALLASVKLGQASELWAQSQDGLPLHSHVVTPPDFTPTKRYPAVVLIHGGPQGAWEDAWQWRWNAQMFAGAGYVVMMTNPRGSEGFGQRFVDQVSGDWGGRAYDDIMRLVDQLVAQPYVDGRKVAAAGASYGGYMVNWLAGHTDRFVALVSHAGVFDLRSMYGETEEIWFPRWEFQGDPWSSQSYDRFSPSRFADKIKTPMLVISNEKDFRVPVGQGMQLFTSLQVRKVPSRLLIFPDENHWVLKPTNSRLWYAVVLDWLHRYLGGAAVDKKLLDLAGTYAH